MRQCQKGTNSSGSSRPEVFLEKGVLKICSKFTGKHPCWSAISIRLLCNNEDFPWEATS